MPNLHHRIFISKFYLDNLIIVIIRINYINFHEIICRYAEKNLEKLNQLV
jgi:hypothetical protein